MEIERLFYIYHFRGQDRAVICGWDESTIAVPPIAEQLYTCSAMGGTQYKP